MPTEEQYTQQEEDKQIQSGLYSDETAPVNINEEGSIVTSILKSIDETR